MNMEQPVYTIRQFELFANHIITGGLRFCKILINPRSEKRIPHLSNTGTFYSAKIRRSIDDARATNSSWNLFMYELKRVHMSWSEHPRTVRNVNHMLKLYVHRSVVEEMFCILDTVRAISYGRADGIHKNMNKFEKVAINLQNANDAKS